MGTSSLNSREKRGFKLNEEQRIGIWLSNKAFDRIKSDMRVFFLSLDTDYVEGTVSSTYKLETQNGMINRIILNFFNMSEVSIQERIEAEEQKLDAIFEKISKANSESSEVREAKSKLIRLYTIELKESLSTKVSTILDCPNNRKLTIRLSEDFRRKKRSIFKEEKIGIYKNQLALYLKAILEDYAQQDEYSRAEIVFQNMLETIKSAVSEENKKKQYLYRATIGKAYYKSDFQGLENWYIKPIRLTTRFESTYPMLICQTSYDMQGHNYFFEAIPIYLIRDFEVFNKSEKSGLLPKNVNDILGKIIHRNSENWPNIYGTLGSSFEEIELTFTMEGYEKYLSTEEMRPTCYAVTEKKRIDTNGKVYKYPSYRFYCSTRQFYKYFGSFIKMKLIDTSSMYGVDDIFHQEDMFAELLESK